MTTEHAVSQASLWTSVLRQIPPEAAAAPATLLAWTAWQQGQDAFANLAVDRALDADPAYSMAHLLREALSAGLPPEAAVPPMTPEQVAQAYQQLERRAHAAEPELEPGG